MSSCFTPGMSIWPAAGACQLAGGANGGEGLRTSMMKCSGHSITSAGIAARRRTPLVPAPLEPSRGAPQKSLLRGRRGAGEGERRQARIALARSALSIAPHRPRATPRTTRAGLLARRSEETRRDAARKQRQG